MTNDTHGSDGRRAGGIRGIPQAADPRSSYSRAEPSGVY